MRILARAAATFAAAAKTTTAATATTADPVSSRGDGGSATAGTLKLLKFLNEMKHVIFLCMRLSSFVPWSYL